MTTMTLSERLQWEWADAQPVVRWLAYAILLTVGVALLTLSAKVSNGSIPVPLSLQTLAVLMLAALYGPKLGMVNILTYMGIGAMGFPIFANGGGLLYMVGSTGGYLLGFVLATFIVGYAARTLAFGVIPFLTRLSVMMLATVLIFALGYVWLAQFIGTEQAYLAGVEPFIVKETVSAVVAAMGVGVFLRGWHWLTQR